MPQDVSKYSLSGLPPAGISTVRTPPKNPPALREPWVVWEYTACLFTDTLVFTTENLHDVIKAHALHQNLPINVFYSPDACWIIEGTWGRAKVDDDRRPRVSMNLRDSRYSDMQFITGIDYFGDCWANFQMMMVVQPEEIEKPPKPVIPDPLLPIEALILLGVFAIGLLVTGNPGLQVFGVIGLIGGLGIWAVSSKNVREASEKQEKWKEQVKEIELEQEEIKRNRLSRSFKSDDLFVFHEVMTKIVSSMIFHSLIDKGATVEESQEKNNAEQYIPPSKKGMFDDY
jgi:hypothetical protein